MYTLSYNRAQLTAVYAEIRDQVDHTLIKYGTIQIVQLIFYDRTMINLESYMVQSMVNLES